MNVSHGFSLLTPPVTERRARQNIAGLVCGDLSEVVESTQYSVRDVRHVSRVLVSNIFTPGKQTDGPLSQNLENVDIPLITVVP